VGAGPIDSAKTLEDIHDPAVATTLDYIENNMAFTRIGAQGVAQLDTDGVIATALTHRDSRAGDADLHTHLTVSNKVRARGHDGIYRWLALDGGPLFKGNGWLLRGDQGAVALDDPRAPVAGLRYFRLVAGDPPGARPHSPLTSCESWRARRSQPGQPHGRRCASAPTIAWCGPAGARPRSGRRSPQRPRGRARCSSQPR
jgi:TrwC relaxase